MRTAAILVNILFPGIGTFLVGKWVQAIFQLLFILLAFIFIITGVGVIIGAPIMFAVWIWAIISAATAQAEPVKVIVIQQKSE